MNQLSSTGAEWRSSSSMIFWGVLTLTVFGCAASFCEFFFGILETAKGYLDSMSEVAASFGNQQHAEGFFKFYAMHGRLSFCTRAFEVLAIGGWVVYVVGLSKFRDAQPAEKGRWLTGSLYSACWLGLVGMACTFVGSFIGIFGLLFRFVGWVLSLISLFKFRGAFNHLSIEESWNSMAQRGAGNLRTSYTFGIIHAFYPIIIFLTILFIGLGSISNIPNITRGFADDGMDAVVSLIGGSIAVFLLLALAAIVLWICQAYYLISGWCKVKNGSLSSVDSDEYLSDNSTVMTLCSILATIVIMALATWFCISPLTTKNAIYTIVKNNVEDARSSEDLMFSEEREESATTYPETEETTTATEEAESQDEPEGNEYTDSYRGSIDGKHAIEMTLTTDGGAYYSGEYFYTKKKEPIQLRGRLTDDYEHLVVEQYVGMEMTGKFEGTLTRNSYYGTWTSADGETSYPFSITKK